MVYRVWSVDTVTGVKQAVLPMATMTWGRALNAGTEGVATIVLSDANGLDVRGLTHKLRRSLVLEWIAVGAAPEVLYAGIILDRSYDPASGVLTISHSDIWWMWQQRLAVDHFAAHVETSSQTYTSLSLGTIAKKNTQLAITADPIFNYGLPVSFPADVAGAYTRTYYGYSLEYLADILSDIISEENGPDIDFVPRWVSDKLDILMRHGSAGTPRLGGSTWEWNLGVPEPGIAPISFLEDARKVITNSVAVGQGSEVSMLTRSQPTTNPLNPATERVGLYKNVSDTDQLADLSRGDQATFQYPTDQSSARIPVEGSPDVSQLALGDTFKLWIQADLWLADGYQTSRLIGFEGDLGEWIVPTLQPTTGTL